MVSSLTAVLFDLDGTLLDGDAAWRSGVDRMRERCPDVSRENALNAWEVAFNEHFHRYLAGEMTMTDCQAARMRTWAEVTGAKVPEGTELEWFEDYQSGYAAGWVAYDDVSACLKDLGGSRLGVITNGDSVQQRAKLAALGLTDAFDAVVASGDIGIAKPDPRIFRLAAERLQVAPERCAFIGDLYETDALAAAAVGMTGIWLDRGAAPLPGTASSPVVRIASLSELPPLLKAR
jgi:putative hydrolase of the HAD superfamily